MKNIILFFLLIPVMVFPQFINVKSVPVSSGDQFLLFPSQNFSIGNVNVALDDKWNDPFINPAKGSRIPSFNVFVLPTFYNITGNLGGAFTLPSSVFMRYNEWFGVISAAYQKLEGAGVNNSPWFNNGVTQKPDRLKNNNYVFVSVGRTLPAEGLSLGGSFFWANLNSMGGVDLLYNQSTDVFQKGDLIEFRTGIMYEKDNSVLEAILLYNNYEMMHEVEYSSWFWDDQINNNKLVTITEKNLDYTDTWGAHISYKEKVNDKGLQIGALATINWKTHPKIPDYDLMNIPRDPGNTWAYNLGIGIGSQNDIARIGFDFIFEPIWSNTWAAAESEINTPQGLKILPGEKTIENDFTFSNWIARFGFGKSYGLFDLGAGIEYYKRSYNLNQYNYINSTNRSQYEGWTELTLSWGIGLQFTKFNLKYSGHMIIGSGIPGVGGGIIFAAADYSRSADIIAAPSGTLNLDEQTISTHQFILQIPIGSQ